MPVAYVADEEADVRPGTDLRDRLSVPALVSLSEEQRRIIEVLELQQQGMTARQLQARLEWPVEGLQQSLDGLLERQLVARLNTIVPSYIYRYRGVDLQVD
jgi:hypothetical protein